MMGDLPKVLMSIGALLLIIGFVWQLIGKIPGDIVIKKGNTTFYFPIVTSIIISVVLSFIFYLVNRFK